MSESSRSDDAGARKFSRRAIFGGLFGRRNETFAVPRGRDDPSRVVRLRTMACLTFRGTACTVCADHCPAPGAIELERGRPNIVADRCTGCGDCVPLCPAPVNALELVPRR